MSHKVGADNLVSRDSSFSDLCAYATSSLSFGDLNGECERGRSPFNGAVALLFLLLPEFARTWLASVLFRFNSPIQTGAPCKKKIKFLIASHCARCLPAAGATIASSHLLPAADPPAVTIRPAIPGIAAKAVTLICREAVEQPHAAGALKPILAAVARRV